MRILSLFAALILCFPNVAASQQATNSPSTSANQSPQRDPQTLSFLAQCSVAMGVPSAIPNIYAEGTITPTNPQNPSAGVLKSMGTDRVRSEINLPSGQQVYVLNSGRGFSLISGEKKYLPAHSTLYFRPELLSAFACGIDLARPNVSISYIRLETLRAATVHHLKFLASSSDPLEQLISEFHVYLDAQTLRIVKTANWVFAPDAIENRSLWESYYDNYQSVGGVLFPMHIQHFLAGKRLDDWDFTSVRTDVPVLQSDFN
jgi:hypothetical protein